jgi:hypothetical protein
MRQQQPRPHIPRIRLQIDRPQRHPSRPKDRFELALQSIHIQRSLHSHRTLPRRAASRRPAAREIDREIPQQNRDFGTSTTAASPHALATVTGTRYAA